MYICIILVQHEGPAQPHTPFLAWTTLLGQIVVLSVPMYLSAARKVSRPPGRPAGLTGGLLGQSGVPRWDLKSADPKASGPLPEDGGHGHGGFCRGGRRPDIPKATV